MYRQEQRTDRIQLRVTPSTNKRISFLADKGLYPTIQQYKNIGEVYEGETECYLGEWARWKGIKSKTDVIIFLVNKAYNEYRLRYGTGKENTQKRIDNLEELIQIQENRLAYLKADLEELKGQDHE